MECILFFSCTRENLKKYINNTEIKLLFTYIFFFNLNLISNAYVCRFGIIICHFKRIFNCNRIRICSSVKFKLPCALLHSECFMLCCTFVIAFLFVDKYLIRAHLNAKFKTLILEQFYRKKSLQSI